MTVHFKTEHSCQIYNRGTVTITISSDSYHVGWRLHTSDREEHVASTFQLKEETVPIHQTIKVSLLEKPQCLVLRLSCVPKKVGVNQ